MVVILNILNGRNMFLPAHAQPCGTSTSCFGE